MSEGTPHLFLRRGCGGRVRGEKDGCGLKKYFICYFDVLGQRDVLKDISSDSFSMPKEVRVKCQLFNRMSLKIVGEVEKVISSWRKRNCQWHGDAGMVQFSDSFVTFVEDCERGRDLFGEMLIEVGCFYWEMLCKAMPIRGVVAYGEASVVSGGSLCGKVFQEISVYERCLAQYSRLVFVGNKDLYQNLPCTICDGVLSLDIFDHLICKRVGVGGMKVGQLTIAETIAKVQQSPVILHKTIQTLRMLGEGGIARLIAGDQNCWEDEDRISKKDPYPRLRPDDYFVAYLRVDKVLLTGETGLIGISSGDVDDTGKVELGDTKK